MWKYMSCPHILNFGGAFYHNGVPAITTLWMPHGNIADYLEKHHHADRVQLVRLSVSQAPGVRYFIVTI